MSLMKCVSWIRVVVKKCYDLVVPSLTEMTLKKLKFILGRTESTMRRMLDPPFTTCKYEHPEQYEDVAKFIDMGNWLVDEVDKKTKKTFECSIRNKIRYNRNISLQVFESVLQEYVKAFCAPPMYTLALLRMGDSYRRYAVIYKLFPRHSRYGINI